MGLLLATYARATVTAISLRTEGNNDIVELTVGADAITRFPQIGSGQRDYLPGVLDYTVSTAYFHVILRYDAVGDDTDDSREAWYEFVRVTVMDRGQGRMTGVRNIGELTNRPDAEDWVIGNGDTITATLVTLAKDLEVLRGVTSHSLLPIGETHEESEHLRLHVGVHNQRFYGGAFHRLDVLDEIKIGALTLVPGTANNPGAPEADIRVPPGIRNGTLEENTLALRGDQTFDGCVVGTFCVTGDVSVENNYPLIGGDYGDGINIARWEVGETETDVTLISQNPDFFTTFIPDMAVQDGETRGTITTSEGSYIVREIEQDPVGPDDTEVFVNLRMKVPNSLVLSEFLAHVKTIRVDDFRKPGALVADRAYIDSGYASNLWAARGEFTQLDPLQNFRFPPHERAPTTDDDVDAGYRQGDVWYDVPGGVLFICAHNGAGEARWDTFYTIDRSGVIYNAYVPFGASQVINLGAGENFGEGGGYTHYSLNGGGQVSRDDFVNNGIALVGSASRFTFLGAEAPTATYISLTSFRAKSVNKYRSTTVNVYPGGNVGSNKHPEWRPPRTSLTHGDVEDTGYTFLIRGHVNE